MILMSLSGCEPSRPKDVNENYFFTEIFPHEKEIGIYPEVQAIYPVNEKIVFLLGNDEYVASSPENQNAYFFSSVDGGKSFKKQILGNGYLENISVTDSGRNICLIKRIYSDGTHFEYQLLHSVDMGEQWNTIDTFSNKILRTAVFINDKIGIVRTCENPAESDGKELDGKVGFVTGLELENKIGNLLAFKGDLVVTPDGAIIIQVKAQAAVQTEKALKTVIQRVKGFAEIVQEGKDENVVPETGFVLAAGLQIVHEACQMPAFVQAHADSQPFIETGLIDDIPSARCKLLFVIGTGFEQEIEFAVVLETDYVLAPKGDLA